MVDMDHFKDVNDTLGHHVGDELLRRVADRIDRTVRAATAADGEQDTVTTVARLGGDEFAVLLRSESPIADAELLAEQVLAVLARPVDVHGQVLSVHCSIGITAPRGRKVDVHTLLSEADIALYEAKRERARWWVFTPGTVTGLGRAARAAARAARGDRRPAPCRCSSSRSSTSRPRAT